MSFWLQENSGKATLLPYLPVFEIRRYENVTQGNSYQVIDLSINALDHTNIQSLSDTKTTQCPTVTFYSVIFSDSFFAVDSTTYWN